MAFMDELELTRQNPSSGGQYFGQPSINTSSPSDAINALMPFYHQIKNRELQDFAAKAKIQNDLALKPNRLQQTFNPSSRDTGMGTAAPQDVIYKPGPSDILRAEATAPISPLDQAKLSLEKDKLNVNKSNLANDNALNEKKFGLDQQKNEQIHQSKEDDLQRKADDANNRLKLAYDQLQAKQNDAQAQLAFHQAQQAAKEAADELKDQQHTAQLDELKRLHDAQIKDMQDKLDALQNSSTVTEGVDKDGNPIKYSTTTTKGSKNQPQKSNTSDPLNLRGGK